MSPSMGLKSRCGRAVSLWGLQGTICFLVFSSCWGHPHSLAQGPFLHLQSQRQQMGSSSQSIMLTSSPALGMTLDLPGSSRKASPSQGQVTGKFSPPLPRKLMYSQAPGIRSETFGAVEGVVTGVVL